MNIKLNKTHFQTRLLLLLLLLFTFSAEATSMSLLSKPEEKVVLFSPMKGLITFKNKPASGAKIERHISWKDQTGETDTTVTNDNGEFDLSLLEETVKLSKISQFVVSQEISVYYHGEKFLIWTMGKSSKDIYGELGGKPVNLTCELTDEETPHRFDDALLMTVCKWDSIENNK